MIKSFNGDVEKFYPNFYKVFVDAENPFRGLALKWTRLLVFEIIYWPTLLELPTMMMLFTSTKIPSFLP